MQMPEPRTPELPPVVFQPQAPRQMPEPLTPEPPPVETIPDASLWFPEPFSPVPPEVVLVPQEPITTPQKPADGGGNGATGQALICPNCGRSNLTDARLCAYCGYAFQPITPAPAPQEDQKAGSHKERFRLKFVDLGVFVLVVSLILPWASIYRNTLFGDSSDIYNAFGAISGFGGGAGINITVLLFVMLSVAAVILVHTKQKVLAVLAGLGGLAVQIYTTVTLSGLSGQSSGDAGIFFDLSTLTMKGGVFVGLAAAVLILIGAIIS
jgi:hypothetical protein